MEYLGQIHLNLLCVGLWLSTILQLICNQVLHKLILGNGLPWITGFCETFEIVFLYQMMNETSNILVKRSFFTGLS